MAVAAANLVVPRAAVASAVEVRVEVAPAQVMLKVGALEAAYVEAYAVGWVATAVIARASMEGHQERVAKAEAARAEGTAWLEVVVLAVVATASAATAAEDWEALGVATAASVVQLKDHTVVAGAEEERAMERMEQVAVESVVGALAVVGREAVAVAQAASAVVVMEVSVVVVQMVVTQEQTSEVAVARTGVADWAGGAMGVAEEWMGPDAVVKAPGVVATAAVAGSAEMQGAMEGKGD